MRLVRVTQVVAVLTALAWAAIITALLVVGPRALGGLFLLAAVAVVLAARGAVWVHRRMHV